MLLFSLGILIVFANIDKIHHMNEISLSFFHVGCPSPVVMYTSRPKGREGELAGIRMTGGRPGRC